MGTCVGVAVGKNTGVGGIGWKGVAVAVGLAGMKSKFGFMLTAAGAATGAMGKLQAATTKTNKAKAEVCFNRIGL